jgi:hypothetical protein
MASTTAAIACASHTLPKRVSRTLRKTDQRRASWMLKPEAVAPSKKMLARATTASATAAIASTVASRFRTMPGADASAHSSAPAPPAISRSSAKSRNRATSSPIDTLPGVPSLSEFAMPCGFAPGDFTWKTNAPCTGCESAEITRQVTV